MDDNLRNKVDAIKAKTREKGLQKPDSVDNIDINAKFLKDFLIGTCLGALVALGITFSILYAVAEKNQIEHVQVEE